MWEVSEAKAFPEDMDLMAWSKAEFEAEEKKRHRAFIHTSEFTWVVTDEEGMTVLVAGVITASMIGDSPELWLLLCEPFKKNLRQNLRDCKAHLHMLLTLYPKVKVRVDATFPIGQRFAEFMGFRQLSTEPERIKDREYLLYEVTTDGL